MGSSHWPAAEIARSTYPVRCHPMGQHGQGGLASRDVSTSRVGSGRHARSGAWHPSVDRGPRGVQPTIYANALLRRSHVVFDELRQGIRDVEFLADPTAGEVRIASTDTFDAGLLPEVIYRISRRYPKIIVRVVQANQSALEFRDLRERNVDLALARIPKSFVDDELDIDILFDDRHFVVVGVRSRWARRRKVALAELMNEPWILP